MNHEEAAFLLELQIDATLSEAEQSYSARCAQLNALRNCDSIDPAARGRLDAQYLQLSEAIEFLRGPGVLRQAYDPAREGLSSAYARDRVVPAGPLSGPSERHGFTPARIATWLTMGLAGTVFRKGQG